MVWVITISPVCDFIEKINSILKLLYGYRREKLSFKVLRALILTRMNANRFLDFTKIEDLELIKSFLDKVIL